MKLKGRVVNPVSKIIKGKAFVDPFAEKLDGTDILVCKRISTFSLSKLTKFKAVITSYGGLLSHAAILMRELNIPCIVGVDNADELIKNGDSLTLDLSTGEINVNGVIKTKLFAEINYDSHPNWGDWGGDNGGWFSDGWSDLWSGDQS